MTELYCITGGSARGKKVKSKTWRILAFADAISVTTGVVLERRFCPFSTQGACFCRAAWTPRGIGPLIFVFPTPRRSRTPLIFSWTPRVTPESLNNDVIFIEQQRRNFLSRTILQKYLQVCSYIIVQAVVYCSIFFFKQLYDLFLV